MPRVEKISDGTNSYDVYGSPILITLRQNAVTPTYISVQYDCELIGIYDSYDGSSITYAQMLDAIKKGRRAIVRFNDTKIGISNYLDLVPTFSYNGTNITGVGGTSWAYRTSTGTNIHFAISTNGTNWTVAYYDALT